MTDRFYGQIWFDPEEIEEALTKLANQGEEPENTEPVWLDSPELSAFGYSCQVRYVESDRVQFVFFDDGVDDALDDVLTGFTLDDPHAMTPMQLGIQLAQNQGLTTHVVDTALLENRLLWLKRAVLEVAAAKDFPDIAKKARKRI